MDFIALYGIQQISKSYQRVCQILTWNSKKNAVVKRREEPTKIKLLQWWEDSPSHAGRRCRCRTRRGGFVYACAGEAVLLSAGFWPRGGLWLLGRHYWGIQQGENSFSGTKKIPMVLGCFQAPFLIFSNPLKNRLKWVINESHFDTAASKFGCLDAGKSLLFIFFNIKKCC